MRGASARRASFPRPLTLPPPALMYSRNPDIIETELEAELILLDPGTGEMFSLNDTGRRIWHSLPFDSPARFGAALAEALVVEADVAEHDVRILLAELHRAGLVRHSIAGNVAG